MTSGLISWDFIVKGTKKPGGRDASIPVSEAFFPRKRNFNAARRNASEAVGFNFSSQAKTVYSPTLISAVSERPNV
jgi:hypothetical protein